jgi:hypothetical protein
MGKDNFMAILRDLTTGKIHKINICYYCNHDKYPDGKPIDPSDKYARHTDRGDWKCGHCVNEDSKKLLSLLGRRWIK